MVQSNYIKLRKQDSKLFIINSLPHTQLFDRKQHRQSILHMAKDRKIQVNNENYNTLKDKHLFPTFNVK